MDYYLQVNNEQKGPYALSQIQSMWNSGTITSDSLYWDAQGEQWKPVNELIASPSMPPPVIPAASVPPLVPPVLPPAAQRPSLVVFGLAITKNKLYTTLAVLSLFAILVERLKTDKSTRSTTPSSGSTARSSGDANSGYIRLIKGTMKVSPQNPKFEVGSLEGGVAVLVSDKGAYWIKDGTVYAANGTAKSWSPTISYSRNPKIEFGSVKSSARGN